MNVRVLEIFLCVSKNKQMLSYKLLDKLIAAYNPESTSDADRLLIEIFASVSRNNQSVPSDLLPKLAKSLKCSDKRISSHAVAIFVHEAQRGESLPDNVLAQLLDNIASETNSRTRQEYIGALPRILQVSDVSGVETELKQILIAALDSNSVKMQTSAIKACQALVSRTLILTDQVLLNKLVNVGTQVKCEPSLKAGICSLFTETRNQLNEDMFRQVEMANLEFDSDKQLLDMLSERVKVGTRLLPINFNQLAAIIESTNESEFLHSALMTLEQNSANRREHGMTDELVESLELLYERSNCPKIKDRCLTLLSKHGVHKLTIKNKDPAADSSASRLFDYFRDKLSTRSRDVGDPTTIEKLIGVFNDADSSCLNVDSSFVQLVEQVLLLEFDNSSPVLVSKALDCYSRIIKRGQATETRELILDYIAGKLLKTTATQKEMDTSKSDVALYLLECIYNAIRFKRNDQLPHQPQPECSFNGMHIIMAAIQNESDVRLRSLAFRALRLIKSKQFEFKKWLTEFMEQTNLVELCLQNENDMSLLELIVSLDHVDSVVFTRVKERKLWPRELLAHSIFTHFKATELEQVEFYNTILDIEQASFDDSTRLITLLQQHVDTSLKSMGEINELLLIANAISDLQTVIEVFENHISPLERLKVEWCRNMIHKRVKGVNQVSIDYLTKLSEDIWANKQLSVAFVRDLFQSISNIDNFNEFTTLIQLCTNQQISLDDFSGVKAENISELKTLSKINHMCRSLDDDSGDAAQRDFKTLSRMLHGLIKKNSWTAEQVSRMLQGVKSLTTPLSPKNAVQNSIDFFNVIIQFKIAEDKYEECLSVLEKEENGTEPTEDVTENNRRMSSWTMVDALTKLNKIGVENSLSDLIGAEKDSSDLVKSW